MDILTVAQVGASELTASSSRGSNSGVEQVNFNFSFVPKVVEGNLNLIYRFLGVQLRM